MKKLFILCLVVAMALSMLCSAVAEQGPSGSITYMCWGSTVERDIVEKICKSYMETHPGTTIELQYVPSEYDTKVTTLVAAGNEPDVAYMNSPLAYSLAENGKLVSRMRASALTTTFPVSGSQATTTPSSAATSALPHTACTTTWTRWKRPASSLTARIGKTPWTGIPSWQTARR